MATAEIVLASPARAGRPLEGRLYLAKAPKAEEIFEIRVECTRLVKTGEDDDRTETLHHDRTGVRPEQDKRGWFLPFRFALPVTVPASEGRGMRDYRWHLKHWSKNAWITTGSPLEVDVAPASPEDMSAFEATLPAADEADVDGLARDLEKLRVGKLRPHERAELRALTPAKRAEMRAMAASTSRFGSFLLKAVLIFFAVMIAAPILIIGLGWAVTALGK